jgi:hypothetical protein
LALWLYIGDFNCVIVQLEKNCERAFAESSRIGLRAFMNDSNIIDIGLCGNKFT